MGKMGSSILRGIINNGLYQKEEIAFYAPSLLTQEKYQNLGIALKEDERALVSSSDIIILAVKPQKYDEILAKLKDIPTEGKIFVSLAPGKTIAMLTKRLVGAAVCRAMPNTPAQIGKATTTLSFNGTSISSVIDIFSSIGSITIIEESKIEEAIPLQGSLPAYLFLFAKAFIEKGKEHGLSEAEAKELLFNSIIGSAHLALASNEDIDTLIDQVCSKGGSTIEGLYKLKDGHFEDAVKDCYEACLKRGKELANV